MIAKKNASIDLRAERQMHVQNGFLVVSALVCAAFAWRSPLVQTMMQKPIIESVNETPIEDKEPEKIPEIIKAPVMASAGPTIDIMQKPDDKTLVIKSTLDVKTDPLLALNLGNIIGDPNKQINTLGGGDDIIDIKEDLIEAMPDKEAMPLLGMDGLKLYVIKNIVYPEVALEQGDEGKVYIEFVVEKNGDVSKVRVARGVSPELDREALRIVNSFGKWIPGESDGKTVRSRFRYGINFTLGKS